MTEVHQGGCLCGNVRYEIEGPLPPACHCHCSQCRRASGAVALTWITVPCDRLLFTRGGLCVYRSSDHGERTFCGQCGASLTFWSSRAPAMIDVTVGTLDEPGVAVPDRHIFAADRVSWLHLDEHLRAVMGQDE